MQTDRFSTAKQGQQVDAGLRSHMQNVYNRMTIGVLITAITAWLVGSSPELINLFLGGPQKYLVIFGPLAIVWFGFRPQSMSSQKLMIAFTGVSVLYGISFSTIAYAFAGAEIARAFFITAGMFAGLSIFGYTTKKDLTAIGSFAVMGMIGVLILSVIGMFVGFSSTMHLIISAATVLIFSVLTAWETQNTKRMYNPAHGDEINSRMAWAAALNLYISFVVMFMNILQLLQNR